MAALSDMYAYQYNVLRKQVEDTPLVFRLQARKAFATFTKNERAIIRKLDIGGMSVHDFFGQWRSEYIPLIDSIRDARTNATFEKSVQKNLKLDADTARARIEVLVAERIDEVRQACVEAMYPLDELQARKMAHSILIRETESIARLAEHYVSYELYRDICEEMKLVVYDRWSSPVVRSLQLAKERRQIKRFTRLTRQQIANLVCERSVIESDHGGLISKMFSLGIDLVSILGARQDYEKALAKLSQANRSSAAKRLALYEKHTNAIRTQYLESLPAESTLGEAQLTAKEIDAVLIAVFDMDTVSRNALTTQFKRYRDIVRDITRLETRLQTES